MKSLKISDISLETLPDQSQKLSAKLEIAGDSRSTKELFYVVPGTIPISVSAEPVIAAILPMCMLYSLDIESEFAVRPGFLKSLVRIQDILSTWFEDLSRISISAKERNVPGNPSNRVGCFFSGGVDSFYSVCKNLPRITDLILVNGFDITEKNKGMWPVTRSSLGMAARKLDKNYVTVETNLRYVCDSGVSKWFDKEFSGDFWGQVLHGSALVSVGLMLSSELASVIVPSSFSYALLRPWGSHPLLDESWSQQGFKVDHDGCEASRFQKIGALRGFPVALEYLRVCYRNLDQKYNCGRCEKCIRTLLMLRLNGIESSSFAPLDLKVIEQLKVHPRYYYYYVELLARAGNAGDQDVVKACEMILGKRVNWPKMRNRAVGGVRRAIRRLGL